MAINVAKSCEGSFYPFTQTFALNDSMLDGRLAKITSPCVVEGTYVVESSNVHIESKAKFTIAFQCDRCLEEVIRDFSIRYIGSYYLDGTEALEGYIPYFNDMVDIAIGVNPEVLLRLPSRVLCKPECKGICQKCGIDLNEGTCDCEIATEASIGTNNNPFAVLQDINNSTGGAGNGSTEG